MPSENLSNSFKDNCWCKTSLSISKQSHGTGVLKWVQECLKVMLSVVALRNSVKDAGTEASVGSEIFLKLSVMYFI